MRHLLTLLILAASAFAQTATISDTIRTPFNGTFSGTVTVSLNSPALAQPLYSGNVTLSGWTQTVTVTAGVFTLTLYTNDLITPGGTSYTATYAPTSGSGWKETWIVPTGATTIREIRSTTVPSPSVRFTPSQITQAGATLGQGLRWNGSIWAPAAVLTDPMTTTGDLITRSGINAVRVGIGSTNQVLTVSGGMPVWASGITGNASTASALAANGTNCASGEYARGVDASGNAEGCTVAGGGGGSGTVTSVSVVSANGVSGTVANPTTTPAITLSLGAITPTSVAATGTVSGSNLSGTNTGDQTNIAGNAGTATALAADPANCSAGTLPRGVDASGVGQGCAAVSLTSEVTGTLPNANTTATSSNTASAIVARDASGNFTAGTVTAALTGNASTATTLATPRAINGVSFDGSAPITITANLPSNPAACPGGQYVTDIAADGTLTCASVAGGAHTQNTDSGTTQASFQIDSTNSGPRMKNSAGTLQIRNAGDSALAALEASTVTASLSGNASTATALAANPTDCTAGQYATTIAANGNLTCAQVAYSQVSGTPSLATVATSGSASDLTSGTLAEARGGAGTVNGLLKANGTGTVSAAVAGTDYVTPSGNVATATALATDPTACAAGQYVSDIAANGTLTCGTPAGGGGSGTVTSVSVSTGLLSVANSTTTPAISISGTSGGIPYFSNGTTLASSAALDAGALVVGGGAGGAPAILANSSVPNAGELRISTTPTPGATRSVFTLGSAITGGGAGANAGTFYALNAPSGFVGDFMRFELNGTAAFAVNRLGNITIGTGNTYGASGVSVSNVATLAFANTSSGASAAFRITGSAGTGSGNFLALRPTSSGTGPDVLRVNADQRAVMIGQTAETASVSNLSLGVFDDTASTGVTRHLIQKAANQGTVSPFEVRDFNATLGDGALLFEIEPDGSFRSLPTGTRPTCASGIRGTYWYTQGGAGVKDAVEVCTKDAADAYAWRVIY